MSPLIIGDHCVVNAPWDVVAPSFAPTDIADLKLWFKADTAVYSDAGSTPAVNTDLVQQWNDQSGNGRNPSQGTSGQRPTFESAGFNSAYPYITFSGGAANTVLNFSSAAPILTSASVSCFVVGQWSSSVEAEARAFSFLADFQNDAGSFGFFVGVSSAVATNVRCRLGGRL